MEALHLQLAGTHDPNSHMIFLYMNAGSNPEAEASLLPPHHCPLQVSCCPPPVPLGSPSTERDSSREGPCDDAFFSSSCNIAPASFPPAGRFPLPATYSTSLCSKQEASEDYLLSARNSEGERARTRLNRRASTNNPNHLCACYWTHSPPLG
jgi:hypothetical protein